MKEKEKRERKAWESYKKRTFVPCGNDIDIWCNRQARLQKKDRRMQVAF